MEPFTVKKIDEMEASHWGTFKRARAELGVSSFGMQVLDLPPNIDQYPEHDHSDDGQEEVFVALEGEGEIEIEGEPQPLEPGSMIRVGPGVKRKVLTKDKPLRMLIIGAVPGKAYEVSPANELGAPDPAAGQTP